MRVCGEIDGRPVQITKHALARMIEMELTPEQIKEILTNPEERFQSKKYPGQFGQRCGEHTLALAEEPDGTLVVVTALYGTMAGWLKAARDGRIGAGRTLKMNAGIPRF